MRRFPRTCGGFRVGGRRLQCRRRSCCVEGQSNSTRIRARAFLWGLRLNQPTLQPFLFMTLNLPGLLDWAVLQEVRRRVVRKLRDNGILFVVATDFATTGLHLHILTFETTLEAGLAMEPSVVLWLEDVARRVLPSANVKSEPVKSFVGSINYTFGMKPGEKVWVLPMALKRKRLVSYSRELLGKPLWLVEREYLREVAAGREPGLAPPRGWFDDYATRALGAGLQRSAPLIEALDGPMWSVMETR